MALTPQMARVSTSSCSLATHEARTSFCLSSSDPEQGLLTPEIRMMSSCPVSPRVEQWLLVSESRMELVRLQPSLRLLEWYT